MNREQSPLQLLDVQSIDEGLSGVNTVASSWCCSGHRLEPQRKVVLRNYYCQRGGEVV